jgi:hypothetical protein
MKHGIPDQLLSITTAQASTLSAILTTNDFGRHIWNITTNELWIWKGSMWAVLASAVDEILEFEKASEFPSVGDVNTYYIDQSTSHIWRWTGSLYIDITQQFVIDFVNGLTYNPTTKTGELGGSLLHDTTIDADKHEFNIDNADLFNVSFRSGLSFLLQGGTSGISVNADGIIKLETSEKLVFIAANEGGNPDRVMVVNAAGELAFLPLDFYSRTSKQTTNIAAGLTTITHNLNLPTGHFDSLVISVRQNVSGVQETIAVKFEQFTANSFKISSTSAFTNCKVFITTALA